VTTQLALTWATMPLHAQPVCWKKRLSVVRGFSRYLHMLNLSTEVPRRICSRIDTDVRRRTYTRRLRSWV